MSAADEIRIYTTLNFVFSALSFLGLLPLGGILIYGIYYSGDPQEEVMMGILGTIFLAVPLLILGTVFLMAGIGLKNRKPWAWGMHVAGACLAAFSCLGVIYMIFALISAFKPEFRAELQQGQATA